MTKPCQACDVAAKNPRTGIYCVGCNECETRMLAWSPKYHAALLERKITVAYWARLENITRAEESIEMAHRRVKTWADRIAMKEVV